MIDPLYRMSGAGGSDRYVAGTYKVSDGTLKSAVFAITVESAAVVSSLKERRFSKTLNKDADVAYTPLLLAASLVENNTYFFEFPVTEIVVASGVLIFHHAPTGRNTDFTTIAPTTTAPATTL